MGPFPVRPSHAAIQRYRASGVWRGQTVVEDVFGWADRTPDAEAILAFRERDGFVRLTYRQLADWVERFTAALAELGIGPGDVVSMQLPNWWEALAVSLACWRRGAVLASVLPTIGSRELERMLARVEASVFITTDYWNGYEYAAAVAEVAPRLPKLRHRVVLGDVVKDDEIDFVQFFQEQSHPAVDSRPTDPDAVALVLFTSGTTGEPKATIHTANTLHGQVSLKLPDQEGTKPRRYSPQSLMHALGRWSVALSLTTGGVSLLSERWEARHSAQLLAENAIEEIVLPPGYLSELLTAVREEGIRLPRLREVTVGGVPATIEHTNETTEVLGLKLRSMWGMTEGGLMLTTSDSPADWAAHSIGRPGVATEVELRALDPDSPLSDQNPGHLMMRGASVCLATVGRDTGITQVLAEHDDGWYDTGDLAVPDGRGGYRLVGRASDRIGGSFMIPVADVEDELRKHPDITDVAIVGYRDNLEGCAVIVSTAPVTLDDVRAYLAGIGMTEWYWPTRVERVDELPRNHMGKVEKAKLRAWVAANPT